MPNMKNINIMQHGCPCGRTHISSLRESCIGSGVIELLPEIIKKYGAVKPFIFDDINTRRAAGDKVRELLGAVDTKGFTFPCERPIPDNNFVGSALMHFDSSCDMVIAVGSGVIGDISKIIANTAGVPMITVATAPSMDGFASSTSSMCRDGFKLSIQSKAPDVIIADVDVIKDAPARLLASGVGDMVAKYISLCEWKIANIILGEYYCENIAGIMRSALDNVAANAKGLAKRRPDAIEAVVRGLILAGDAMALSGVSRPASGLEHYISHVWDMRAEAFGTPCDLHGIQCGIGTLISLKLYEHIRTLKPCRQKALAHAATFDKEAHFKFLCEIFGEAAKPMIEAEKRDRKYDAAAHIDRIDSIISHWDEVCSAIDEMLPAYSEVEMLLRMVGAPTSAGEIALGDMVLPAIRASRDVRYKYIASHLLWDLGEEIPEIF